MVTNGRLSVALSTSKFAEPSRDKSVRLSMRGSVRQGLREFARPHSLHMEDLVGVRLHMVEVQLLADMEQHKLLSVAMFPRKNVEMCQDNNVEIDLNKSATQFPDNNVTMSQGRSVQQFHEKFSVKNAPTSPRDSVLMSQWRSARMFPSRCQEEIVRQSLLKSVSLPPDKNARASQRSNVSLLEEKLAKMSPELCAEMFQPRLVRMFHEKFLETSARQSI